MRTARTAALRRQLNAIAEELARLEARPEEPTVGSIIKFNMQFTSPGTLYNYAAIRAGDGKWYTAGPRSPKGFTWDQMLDWMEEGTDGYLLMRPVYEGWTAIEIEGDA